MGSRQSGSLNDQHVKPLGVDLLPYKNAVVKLAVRELGGTAVCMEELRPTSFDLDAYRFPCVQTLAISHEII